MILTHGYAEHGARYAHVAESLADDGAAVYAEDHIGHGHSDGERALITDFEHVVDDLHTLVGIARRAQPDIPVVMVGHSMGGLLTARYVQRHPASLAGAGFLGAVLGNWKWAREALRLPELPQETNEPSGMSRDVHAAAGYEHDPLIYHGAYKRPLLEAEVVALDRFDAEIDRLSLPVLLLHGSDDPFVPPGDSVDAVLRMPSKDKEIRVFPGARHELVHEINRTEVVDVLRRWIERVT
ncbi:MAG: lysophospholipase [Myxococcales bacterium]|nr:lysophospholipase [Myxococcales bacterium]